MQSYRVEEIAVDKIATSKSQSRTRNVMDGIEELAANISKIGLIHPITVFEKDGKYELVAGQRRLLAIQQLGWKTVPAHIVSKPESDVLAKAYSFSETFMRTDMVDKDLIDACTMFYETYGTIKAVAEELGLPYQKVLNYVHMAQLPDKLKELVRTGSIKLARAKKAVEFATDADLKVDPDKAVELAVELSKMSGTQVKQVAQKRQADPEATVAELVEAGEKPPKVKQLKLELHVNGYNSLSKYTRDANKVSEAEAAVDLLLEALTDKGYYEEGL